MGLIPAAAVFPLVIYATEMEGGGGVDGDLSPSVGGLIPGGVTVLEKYQGCSGSNPGRANCSREDSRWCSITSNTRKDSSNPGGELVFPGINPSGVVSRPIPGRVVRTLAGTGVSWYKSKWCSVTSSSVYSRSPFCL